MSADAGAELLHCIVVATDVGLDLLLKRQRLHVRDGRRNQRWLYVLA